jgi:uncharacterized phage protein gp47/JayE
MPWTTPTLKQVRATTRDNVLSGLRAAAMVPNAITRIVSDAMSGLAYLTLLYIDWLAKQLLPDSAEDEWLERHGKIWLVNSDGTTGRKSAALSDGTITVTGTAGMALPLATQLQSVGGSILFETTQAITVGTGPTVVSVRALTPGAAGNLDPGTYLSFTSAIPGIDGQAVVVALTDGADQESIDDLRARVLERIQEPPMGGDAEDYVAWALRVPGVTRAWASPSEMGIGTVTVRFMCDELRASNAGFPLQQDIDAVSAYLNTVRPVAVKDFFVVAPVPEPIDFLIDGLDDDSTATRAAITAACTTMLQAEGRPAYAVDGVPQEAQTIFAAWVSAAVLGAAGVNSFDLVMDDHPMPSNGSLAVLGNISYG